MGEGARDTRETRGAHEMHAVMRRQDSYKFVSGDSDQGLLWSRLYVAHGVGTWAHEALSAYLD